MTTFNTRQRQYQADGMNVTATDHLGENGQVLLADLTIEPIVSKRARLAQRGLTIVVLVSIAFATAAIALQSL